MRLLVTGSRSTHRVARVQHALLSWQLRSNSLYVDEPVTLVHGACPHPPKSLPGDPDYFSVDMIANEIAREIGWDVEAYPADWYKHDADCYHKKYSSGFCPAAGPRRNKIMVDTLDPTIDYVIGFPQGESRGTRGCLKLAKARGIQVATIEL